MWKTLFVSKQISLETSKIWGSLLLCLQMQKIYISHIHTPGWDKINQKYAIFLDPGNGSKLTPNYRVSSYRPWNFGITKKWSILTKLKIAKENINQNMTPFDILKVLFFRPTFFRPILKSGISTDYYCFNQGHWSKWS